LNKLAVTDTYNGGEQIYTVSGLGMHIKHVGMLLFVLLFVILILIMSFMSLNRPRILLPFTKLFQTIMSFLNFTYKGPEKVTRGRQGEWEPIKIAQENLTYVSNLI
jgi:hypothetical protein